MFLPGESHGQKSLVGYSPWGCKEWDMTEWFKYKQNTKNQKLHELDLLTPPHFLLLPEGCFVEMLASTDMDHRGPFPCLIPSPPWLHSLGLVQGLWLLSGLSNRIFLSFLCCHEVELGFNLALHKDKTLFLVTKLCGVGPGGRARPTF